MSIPFLADEGRCRVLRPCFAVVAARFGCGRSSSISVRAVGAGGRSAQGGVSGEDGVGGGFAQALEASNYFFRGSVRTLGRRGGRTWGVSEGGERVWARIGGLLLLPHRRQQSFFGISQAPAQRGSADIEPEAQRLKPLSAHTLRSFQTLCGALPGTRSPQDPLKSPRWSETRILV